MREAFSRAGVAIWAARDILQSFEDLTELEEFGKTVTVETANTRAALAAAIVDDRGIPQNDLATEVKLSPSRMNRLVQRGRNLRRDLQVSETLSLPEPPHLGVAIVTNSSGVLVGKRIDGVPPWTFPATEIRADESVGDCITRNVPRETGVDVTPKELLGRRFHPRTGWIMVYVSASPSGPDVTEVLDPDLEEVRWMSLDEVLKVMPDMFPAVKTHLQAVLGGREP